MREKSDIQMELVCRVTWNKSVDIVRKHYFKPGQAAMKDAFLKSTRACWLMARMARAP